MNAPWTDALVEPLSTALRDGDWRMVQRSREGDWLALPVDSQTAWFRIGTGSLALEPLSPLEDRKLPILAEHLVEHLRTGEDVRLLAWRVGRRAVVRRHSARTETIDKLYRRPHDLSVRWSALRATADQSWRPPIVHQLDEARGVLSMEVCQGASLNALWLAGQGEAEHGDRLAHLLDWIAETPVPPGLPSYRAEDEIQMLERRFDDYVRTLRRPDPETRGLVTDVSAALESLPAAPPVLCHRDLHDKQIVLERGHDRGRLLDLDLLASGPRGLDAGNLLAHLRLRELCGAALPWAEIGFRLTDAASTARERETVSVWTAAALARLVLIYARRRRPPGLLSRLTLSARHSLGGDGEWRTILGDRRIERRARGS